MTKITPHEMDVFSSLIYNLTGIGLDNNKAYLVEARLQNLLEELKCVSFSELYYKAKLDTSNSINEKIIDAITTKETFFFRDIYPFELLKQKVLPELLEKKAIGRSLQPPRDIRIWSAACSTGQEAYSIAIIIKELFPEQSQTDVKILATDISDQAIGRAAQGIYNKFEVERGLNKKRLHDFFTRLDNNHYKVKGELRTMITFTKHNLMDTYSHLGKFDIIFCRNVAIYFAHEDKGKLYNKLVKALEPGGYLIVGSSEVLLGINSDLEYKIFNNVVFYQAKNNCHPG